MRVKQPLFSLSLSNRTVQVNTEAARRIASATAVLQDVLQAGSPGAMETAMAKAVTQGRVDEAVLNLLDANIVVTLHLLALLLPLHPLAPSVANDVAMQKITLMS
jgi:hypothetical protein